MKNYLIFLICILLSICSCYKEDVRPPYDLDQLYFDDMHNLLNNTGWAKLNGGVKLITHSGDTIAEMNNGKKIKIHEPEGPYYRNHMSKKRGEEDPIIVYSIDDKLFYISRFDCDTLYQKDTLNPCPTCYY